MVCLYCLGHTKVVNSRLQKQSNNIWRRRKCLSCAATFTTKEQPALSSGFVVTSRHRPTELRPFHREILFVSIMQSCGHRSNAANDAIELTNTVIAALPWAQGAVLTTQQIADKAHTILSRFDKVAATYYRAYYIDR